MNDELAAIEDSLEQAFEVVSVGGRISVISFHSLEDRIVKTMFKQQSTVEKPEELTDFTNGRRKSSVSIGE